MVSFISKSAPQVSNAGPPGGQYSKLVTSIGGFNTGQEPGFIGSTNAINFATVASVVASQTNLEVARLRLNADSRLNSITWGVEVVAGTATFDIIDISNANASVIGATTLTAGAAGSGETSTFSSTSERLLPVGTVLALRVNTAAASTVAGLSVTLNTQVIGIPTGQHSFD